MRDGNIYKIYNWIQQIQYAANRYEDELAEKYSSLMKLCSVIYGQCLAIFEESDEYMICHMLSEIAKIIYIDTYQSSKKDGVTKYLIEHREHHYFSRPFPYTYGCTKIKLKEIWKSLVVDNSMQNRIYCFLQIKEEYSLNSWEKIMKLVNRYRWNKEKFEELKVLNISKYSSKSKQNSKDYKEEKMYNLKNLLGI